MKTTLNTKLWKDDKLKPEVRETMMKIGYHFYDYLKVEVPLIDIVFVGSLANYNWHSKSDIDLHLIIDYSKLDCSLETGTELLLAKKTIYNTQRSITIKGYEVEVYVENEGKPSRSNGVYSILNDKWLEKPKPNNKAVKNGFILKIGKIYQELIDDVVNLPDDELKLKLAQTIKNDVYKKRLEGLKDGGEHSEGNLLFKKLRKDEFYRLFDAIAHAQDKQLSLERFNR